VYVRKKKTNQATNISCPPRSNWDAGQLGRKRVVLRPNGRKRARRSVFELKEILVVM
jgi:hypothetical protein